MERALSTLSQAPQLCDNVELVVACRAALSITSLICIIVAAKKQIRSRRNERVFSARHRATTSNLGLVIAFRNKKYVPK
jgi:hypothetical protein